MPGWTADNHPDKTEAILRAGHEIGHHGYDHTWPEIAKPDEEEAEIVKGLEALKRVVGVVPKGYRCPAGETTDRLLPLLVKHGFLYDSSFMDDTFPYRHRLADGRPGPVELPWHWTLDDVPYMVYSLRNPRRSSDQRAHPVGLEGRVPRDLPLGRPVRPDQSSAGDRPAVAHRAAARSSSIHPQLSQCLVRDRHADCRGVAGAGPAARGGE